MKETRLIMGMPVTVEIVDPSATTSTLESVFNYFVEIDERFSTYKPASEISRLNQGEVFLEHTHPDMQTIFGLAEQTRQDTEGYFNIWQGDHFDPSGIVKGWAIYQAAEQLAAQGVKDFYIDAGSDIEARGLSATGEPWRVGIRHPFSSGEIVKVLSVSNRGVATSGTYERGQHIYNPHQPNQPLTQIVSLTVIGPNIYEADRYATAAFAMGQRGIAFIDQLPGFEGYMIDRDGLATYTTGFEQFTVQV